MVSSVTLHFSRRSASCSPRARKRATLTTVADDKRDVIAVPDARRDRAIAKDDEPPVVARMVVEIRSDGTRTIARGAAEDASTGEKVAIEIAGSTPLQLALSLMKTMAAVPALARNAARALRQLPRRDRDDDD